MEEDHPNKLQGNEPYLHCTSELSMHRSWPLLGKVVIDQADNADRMLMTNQPHLGHLAASDPTEVLV